MKHYFLTPLLLCSAVSLANEHTSDTSWYDFLKQKRDSGGFFSAGLAVQNSRGLYQSEDFKVRPEFKGAYYFNNGLFIEYPGRSDKFDNQTAMGYNLGTTENWEFDVLLSMAHGELSYTSVQSSFKKDASPYFGVRAIGTIAGFDTMLVYGTNSNKMNYSNGLYGAAWLGKSWNVNNWHLYSSVGAQYRNAAMLDFYYGVPDNDAVLPAYDAKGGVNFIYRAGFKKPLNENWLVEGNFSVTRYADSIIDSPYSQSILQRNEDRSDTGRVFSLSISYVF
ncbi:MAG: MipA/OmpV family protein [Gammaproteobacteria bacterium]|nr:MipA/OmpV family protein [Gammaproteobacteria bacterium]MBU1554538.1 MipA/OmpV family protein [Gammaproteobacteria bacterium]MBU2072223.1 MipA/OmpV family protein [Gammaproteobacteria bacterium]MBU2182085.1 MipA/OmpV family protein [Gammaproteobacteria bacterium]MBU2203928.1 MipA/OmpV family protein [Gammaproteobacteria bacterium]